MDFENAGSRIESSTGPGFPWQKIWALKVPSKIKVFMWKVCHDSLPSNDNLYRRRVLESPRCVLCGGGRESITHALLQCNWAVKVWREIIKEVSNFRYMESIKEWIGEVLDGKVGVDPVKVAVTAWSIWSNRNNFIMEGRRRDEYGTREFVEKFIRDFEEASGKNGCLVAAMPMDVGSFRWCRPEGNKLKLNTDAAIFAELGAVGYGAVVRDGAGEVILAMMDFQYAHFDAFTAECGALIRGLRTVLAEGVQGVEVEVDCLNLAIACNSVEYDAGRCGHLIMEIKRLVTEVGAGKVGHVRRQGNAVAHELAKFSQFSRLLRFWRFECPYFIRDVVFSDRSSC